MVTLRWDIDYHLFKASEYYFWMWFLAGVLGAILCFRYWDLGVTFSGAFGGFAVAMGIIAVSHQSISTAGRYALLAFFVLFGAAIATFYERYSIIIGTSFGGAYMFMYGVDEFAQVGYREMIVILVVIGKALVYHPNTRVFIMIGCSFALACMGIAWEFWHHEKPLWLNRKALFRIYGRPFGKRPEKLVGQRIKEMNWINYWMGCLCLRRKTAEEVLYEDAEEAVEKVEDGFVVVGNMDHTKPAPVTIQVQDAEILSIDESVTVVLVNSVISSKSSSQNWTDGITHGERPMSLLGLSPVQIVIEETDYEVEDDGKVLPIESSTEFILKTGLGRTESEAGPTTDSETRTACTDSTARTGRHRSSTTATAMTTVTTLASSSISSSQATTVTYLAQSESTELILSNITEHPSTDFQRDLLVSHCE